MSTVKEGVATAAAPAIPTMLPTTCGEETDLPGVPRVGCIATVSCCPGTLHGFSASVIATADSVAILGPDLEQRRKGRHCLFTRHLWRPASLLEAAAAAQSAGAGSGAAGGGPASVSLASSPSSPLAAGLLSHTDGSGVNIIALTACSLAQPSAEDAVAVVVAWSDSALQHHVTVVALRLRCVLSPSWPGYSDGALVRLVAQDAFPLPSTQSVLRLFCHPAMTAADAAKTDELVVSSRHVILCSLYAPWTSSPTYAGQFSHAEGGAAGGGGSASGAGGGGASVGGGLKKVSSSVAGGGAGVAERSNAAPATSVASPRRRGQLCFLTVAIRIPAANAATTNAGTDDDEDVYGVTAGPSTIHEVAPWLRDFHVDRVVCAFTVQSASTPTRVIAAAGTTDGRVFVLGASSHRLVRRVSGPVADAVFVRTTAAKADVAARSAVVDEILSDAAAEDAVKNGSFAGAAEAEMARRDESEFTALVVLDSAGHLLVLRAVNSGAPITQAVPDLPQIITLANGQKQTLTFVSPSLTNLDEEAQISSKNFLDLSTLRHFIGHRRPPPLPPRRGAGSAPSSGTAPLASSSLSVTPVDNSFSMAGTGGEEPHLSGHILSRGLLCVTNIEGGKGGSELVVSTMGQVVVSVPFSPTEGCFRIAGFTVTPAPMFYVGFVDFFSDGNPTLVMAGLKNVLVASRPQSAIRERAQLLLRLLSKKERERRHTDSDDGVDS